MKLFIIPALLVALNSYCNAQSMLLSALTEYTVAGPQYGVSMMYESKKQLGAGVFYQMDVNLPLETKTKNTFYGGQFQIPIAKAEKLSFYATLRCGLVNDTFVVVVPGVETSIKAGKRLRIGFGMSLRMNYPSVSGKLSWKLF